MVKVGRPPANAFVAVARKVYNPVGFSKGYNFILFFIFAGALMGFTLARLQYLDYYGIFCGSTGIGECYFFTKGIEEIGLIVHLATILPASFLVVFQFVPAIRHRWIMIHRINGYVILVLSIISIIFSLMAARRSFGGGLDTQVAVGFIGILFIICMVLGYINIKRLQLEQHRAWMLRGWFYASSIITLRFIQIIMTVIISPGGQYYGARLCSQVDYTIGENRTRALYPDCDAFYSGADLNKQVLVQAKYLGGGNEINAGAAFGLAFGPSMWLAFALHAIGIEIYLRLTPCEAERLRTVSYQRQQEAGMANPGRAGLTADRLGDAAIWKPTYSTDDETKGTAQQNGNGE
ncbi:uncharacterized protein BDCG_03707 [Blastomyces dermatitidis ER-3]|uniref:Microtubule associated protein n=3 Tax=Blastomyces TaxID=229219 RepID=A0A179UCK7_BLAGS|nr:uncharacterized protein BDBG_01855 [Blastomyces gilchristii SLH14081]XP_045275685.1 uncharacterized protein BDCG_03707 [Blastomyces dermatitidis ER-3]EGE77243.1 hypothetical protein BDDG_00180 [Blastomyces dermatitidis ATCC 18188]EQL38678.1 hypothetical protein BDFG_00233 [Blastomyces dermatitidis ATCC 26199]EEQ88587.1 hypothetical protein BDCG_03707 [Blastomyces dermatitidis ER-3]OAT05463.1 hypothetical protein BDBG_01855 [Blastomyces gilchristii SLH14081]